ncbi:hypothetical protein [Streptomyces griseofuscus]|uniref:hypothetical protein n=1 Tax=Streptomyces griseofuscus TaxID=146922 RepID=UPI00367BE6C4
MTGPEFAAAHGNDSSNWLPADFETEINLAMADIQPAYLLTHPTKPNPDHNLAA